MQILLKRIIVFICMYFSYFHSVSQKNIIKKYTKIIEESPSIYYLPITITKEINSKTQSKKDSVVTIVNKLIMDSILTDQKNRSKKQFIALKIDTFSTKNLKKDFYRIYKSFNDDNDVWVNSEEEKTLLSDLSINILNKAEVRFLLIYQIEGSYFNPQFKKQSQKEQFSKNLTNITSAAAMSLISPGMNFLPSWQSASYQDLKLYFIVFDTQLKKAILIDNLINNENPKEKKQVEKLTNRMIDSILR